MLPIAAETELLLSNYQPYLPRVLVTAAVLLIIFGGAMMLPGLCLVADGFHGKFRVRDRTLAIVPWRGDEQVLEVGTGRGRLC